MFAAVASVAHEGLVRCLSASRAGTGMSLGSQRGVGSRYVCPCSGPRDPGVTRESDTFLCGDVRKDFQRHLCGEDLCDGEILPWVKGD